MHPGSPYFKFWPLEKVGWPAQARDHRLKKSSPLPTVSLRIYLEEGSKLCIAVINRRTMNAHTKFDLNTSSLIWEYCDLKRRRNYFLAQLGVCKSSVSPVFGVGAGETARRDKANKDFFFLIKRNHLLENASPRIVCTLPPAPRWKPRRK